MGGGQEMSYWAYSALLIKGAVHVVGAGVSVSLSVRVGTDRYHGTRRRLIKGDCNIDSSRDLASKV